jgi:Na+/proline symporter
MIYLLGYIAILITFVFIFERGRKINKNYFFVANRSVSGISGAMSIAASWVWAPALFVSTQTGFQHGYSGLVWFVVPNILALCIFGPLGQKLKAKLPEGFSYIEFIQNKSKNFFRIQLTMQLCIQCVCYAIQLTAGAKLIHLVFGLPYEIIVIIMGISPLFYTVFSGLSASVKSDVAQYIIMCLCIAFIYIGLNNKVDLGILKQTTFNPFDPKLMMEFGIASALTLLFGIFNDHQQWQRCFAVKDKTIPTFIGAGLLHGVITFSLGSIGVMLMMSGFEPQNMQIVGAEFISQNLPPIFLTAFMILILCGLFSTLDSALCAFSSLYALHIRTDQDPIKASRESMVILAIGSTLIGITNIPLITLWMFAGILRLSSVVPTIISVLNKNFCFESGAKAILCAIILAAPAFIYASLENLMVLRTCSMIGCIGISLISYLLFSKLKPLTHKNHVL